MLRRILVAASFVLLALSLAPVASAQAPTVPAPAQTSAATPQMPTDAVGIVVMLEDGKPMTLDLSFPGPVTMSEITTDLRKITQWTGWVVSTPQFENLGGSNSAHMTISDAPAAQGGLLNDVVWPLVAALAEHGRLGIVIMGAPASVASLHIENRYVTLEQSGGQGVQSFQAFIKDTSFKNLEELKRAEISNGASAPSGGRAALAWILVIIASVATGVAVYLYIGRKGKR